MTSQPFEAVLRGTDTPEHLDGLLSPLLGSNNRSIQ